MANGLETLVNDILLRAEESNRIEVPEEIGAAEATTEDLARAINALIRRQRELVSLDVPEFVENVEAEGEAPPHGMTNLPPLVDTEFEESRILDGVGSYTNPFELYCTLEGTKEAQEDEWKRDSPPEGTDGVTCCLTTRVFYDHDIPNPIIYGFWRKFTKDSLGGTAEISEETRYIIDAAVPCLDLITDDEYATMAGLGSIL